MFKIIAIVLTAIIAVSAKPSIIAPVAYSAPLLAAGPAVVTAQSSQVVARNYNGLAAAPLVAAAPLAYAAAPALAYSAAPALAYSVAPAFAYSATPALAYSSSPLAYSANASPLGYSNIW